ncbi:unnamed protein product, partial [Durusdinium trenchii]
MTMICAWFASPRLRQSKTLVLAAVSRDGAALQFASPELCEDREVVLAAVEQESYSLTYASESLKSDRDFLLLALACNGRALEFLSGDCKKDMDLVLAAVTEWPVALRLADPELRRCKPFVLALLERRACKLNYPAEELWADRDFVLAAVQIQSSSFQAAALHLRADREIAWAAVQRHGYCLEFASSDLRADKALVLRAVQQYAFALKFAPELQDDPDIVWAAVARHGCSLRYASETLRADRALVLRAVEQQGFALQFAAKALQKDHEALQSVVGWSGFRSWGGGQRVHARGQSDRMVAIRPEQIDAWFDLASTMVSECGWELAANHPEACLYHRSSPSGNGHLIKINVEEVFIEDAPALARELLVRPEVRAQFHEAGCKECWIDWKETLAPGDALVEQANTCFLLRVAALLFGDFSGPYSNSCFYNEEPILARHQLRTDCPEEGSSTYACFQENHGTGQEQMVIARGTGRPDYFQIIVAFTTPEDRWARWATPFFSLLTDTASIAIKSYLNRPGVKLVRQLNSKFYCILSLRSYNRGPPLLPSETDHVDGVKAITVTAGEDLGLSFWVRFDGHHVDGKFHLAQYLQRFMEQLKIKGFVAYESLDSHFLVPYQCVVLREKWEAVRARFHQAFTFQKAAYRRGNGGTAAPSLVEDAPARFCERPDQPPSDWFPVPKVVVHKTFLELDEDVGPQSPVRKIKSEK